MPYRSARVDGPKLTPEAGIVDDMVRQFADRHAFLRELVQNGIDAGATRIDVRLERNPEGEVRTSVEDDGCGMTRAIIEGPLLTLFQSSKESDSSKIGKYGIGFVSVFALKPDRVDVRTRREGEAWLVRLFADHSFELVTDVQRPGTGTEVTLLQTMTAEHFAVHAQQTHDALVRWCRHARVPITLASVDGYDGGETRAINAELTLPGVAVVAVTEGEETFVVAVGDTGGKSSPLTQESSTTFGGFYNRGLTLMESTDIEPGLEGIRFKISSPHLSHTLSRDSVRRDDESRRVLARVRKLVEKELWSELQARIAEAALEATTAGCERYATLLSAVLAPPFESNRKWAVAPLVDPLGTEAVKTLNALRKAPGPMLIADASTPLTRALAKAGQPVVRHVVLSALVRQITHLPITEADRAFAFASALAPHDEGQDLAFVSELTRLLCAAGRNVARTRLASFDGIAKDSSCRVVDTEATSAFTLADQAMERPWGDSATLFLNADHATIRLARRRAKTDAAVAAHLVCRAILIAEGPLDAKVVDRLLEAAAPAERRDG